MMFCHLFVYVSQFDFYIFLATVAITGFIVSTVVKVLPIINGFNARRDRTEQSDPGDKLRHDRSNLVESYSG